ncbi:hypothetical protein AC477_04300 [miscellaneous Crenarchaeota group-1 archaeon SG8-32-1]|uniref:Uncharacterized protein n=1 Tax=miscellaneous Crenarchaeota group-1 archaeon SG8-32-1 TaxID=1685124 RepID=A0A0M0BS92_9ARCH|nr:MAG: hypothetical protein AC477_04300 [miscellaneous Crenarchaeota group-1 archaeon SG8-32-1]
MILVSKKESTKKFEESRVSIANYENGEVHYKLVENPSSQRKSLHLIIDKLKENTRKQAAEPLFISRRE